MDRNLRLAGSPRLPLAVGAALMRALCPGVALSLARSQEERAQAVEVD
jgi:hypothetical protein